MIIDILEKLNYNKIPYIKTKNAINYIKEQGQVGYITYSKCKEIVFLINTTYLNSEKGKGTIVTFLRSDYILKIFVRA